jgi:hypothetical protein
MKGRLKATTVAAAAVLALLATGSGAADTTATCMGETATIGRAQNSLPVEKRAG